MSTTTLRDRPFSALPEGIEASPNLHQRLIAVKQAIGHLGKDAQAPREMGGFAYTSWEAVSEKLGELLARNGVVLWPSMVSSEQHEAGVTSTKKPIYRTRVRLDLTFVNADDPKDSFSITWEGEGDDTSDKSTQKAATSAEKYALLKLFLLGTAEGTPDSDRDSPQASTGRRIQNPSPDFSPSASSPTTSRTGPKRTSTGRGCPDCGTGTLEIVEMAGGRRWIGCSNYPECRHTEKAEKYVPADASEAERQAGEPS